MIEIIQDFLIQITLFDYIFFILTIYFVLQGSKNGFVLSLLSTAKWVLAYILTIYFFPLVKPYFEGLLDSEYVLDISIGVILFILIIFVILLANKAISKVITYSGLGTVDKVFGFFFGNAKSYVLIVCLYTAFDVIYDSKKWPIDLKDSLTFPWVEKGSIYLIKVFPNQKQYDDAKEKVQEI
ncbi:CvpA family protein [Candidatus Pelagibacter sp.]|nr:CvpA family protein [Candidatus Pelagibacter sp.]